MSYIFWSVWLVYIHKVYFPTYFVLIWPPSLFVVLYTERKIWSNLFGTGKFILVLQPTRIFLCNKEKFISFKCLLLYFIGPLLKNKAPVLWFKYDFLNSKHFFSYAVKLIQIFSQCRAPFIYNSSKLLVVS